MQTDADPDVPHDDPEVHAFWELARAHAGLNAVPGYFGPGALESVPPPVWSFGATPEVADELLSLVLSGVKTATASAYEDYAAAGEPEPSVGTLSIVADGAGRPQALLSTVEVAVVPFDEVDEEHARLEGEGDLSLEHWRTVHERFFTEHAERGFRPDMPVLLERFEVIYPRSD